MRTSMLALFLVALPFDALAYHDGYTTDAWGYVSITGCNSCHNTPNGTNPPTLVSFSGPGGTLTDAGTLSADAGVAGLYTLVVSLGNGSVSGINVTAYSPVTTDAGTLSLCTGTGCSGLQAPATNLAGTTTLAYGPQITHTSSHAASGGLVTYAFNYLPTGDACSAELHVWVQSSNNNGTGSGDNSKRFIFTINADGQPCNDFNACTTNSHCSGGVCGGGTPVACPAIDSCHDAGVCNPNNGQCSTPVLNDGTACSDGNLCTTGDVCTGGFCDAGTATVCNALDGCHTAGACDPATGACTDPVKNDGSACSDSNPCTLTDTCVDGGCTGANPVTCAAIDVCHDAGVCDTGTGMCTTPAAPDGTECADGTLCTQGDHCVLGTCVSGTQVDCAAADDCHDAGMCSPSTGLCTTVGAPNGTICSIGVCESAVCTAVDGGAGGGAGGGSATGGGSGTGGGTATGGGSTATGGGTSAGGGGTSTSGCGCDSTFGSVWFAALAVLLLRRRR